MDPKDLRTLKILEKVDQGKAPSQRELAGELNISLGLVNSFIKRLVRKGYVKITTIPKKRIRYLLTPRGAGEKTRLTYEYIQYSYKFYIGARQKLRNLYDILERQGVRRIVFYGVGDLAEIAYVSLQDTSIELVAIVDDDKAGTRYLKQIVASPACLDGMSFDRILITSMNSRGAIIQKTVHRGISPELVIEIG
jgi:DNA-binding MarR family transcriptional regulator